MLGSGGVSHRRRPGMVKQIARLARFFFRARELRAVHQCAKARRDDEDPRAHRTGRARLEDLDTLLEIAENMTGKTICVLSDSCATPVVSGIKKFREESKPTSPASGAERSAEA